MTQVNKGMTVETNGEQLRINQDADPYRDYAHRSRQIHSDTGGTRYRSFAIIPDIVALDILAKHGINVHASDFMSDINEVNKLKQIIRSEFPDLLTS